jgi:hypothetical protein
MYRSVNTSQLSQVDLWTTYNPPINYDLTTAKTNETELSLYSSQGKLLREQTSYFIEGDANDTFYKKQVKIAKDIKDNNNKMISTKDFKKQIVRYDSFIPKEQMTKAYNGEAYTVDIDGSGNKRIFIIENNTLTIKSSSNFKTWMYDIIGAEIHRNFLAENKGEKIEIKNIQIVKNKFEENTLSLLYFHNGMLFLRNFQSNLISVNYNNENEKDDTQVRNYFKITTENGNKPIFLLGNIPDEIRNEIGKKDIITKLPILTLVFPYDNETLKKFNEDYAIDDDTQSFGHYVRKGTMRVFYKDSFGNLRAVSINGPIPYPETWYKVKGEYL